MSKKSAPLDEFDNSLTAPDIIGVLEPVPGGEENLLPKDAWLVPLRVEFELWSDYAPVSGLTDVVQLIWDGDENNPVAEKHFEGTGSPFDPSLLWLQVPTSKLDEGVHSLYYRLQPWNGSPARTSVPVSVTVDKTAPVTSGKLIFPAKVLPPNQITAAYLADPVNQDQVLATVPEYTVKKVGDVITWYWELSPGGREVAGTRTLEQTDIGQPVQVSFTGDLLRRANGVFYATYRVCDRAGNKSVLSNDEKLDVNIRPPTPRKFPTVQQANSTPSGTGILNPLRGTAGVIVVVAASEVDPDEAVLVDFIGLGGEGGIGSVMGVKPTTPGGLEFAIPAPVVAANIPVSGDGRKVEVWYWAGHETQHSAVYTLAINELSGEAFGSVGCPEAQIGSPATLSKSKVALSGANIEIDKWAYHEVTQRINVWSMASGVRTDFLTDAPTPLNASGKFVTPLPKDYVAPLPLNETFTLYASVSFDQGHSYRLCKPMAMKLVT
ncbi:hypothetical protein BLL42_01440 [Pseudomonas frederiksbergensis]|uniref:Uncharacterized protein n=1 Tax=Pseudomonas frederiksbergensis TaxID=104087 RepID=A0A1J0EF82_9PSED|nr:hypothetical protein [Pseudomonas frederiksbergensis]APC14460.1 hypothetical protein BLL42_01440 [Pseudomonas frederiksbergensis]